MGNRCPPAVADRIDCLALISWRSLCEGREWRSRFLALRDAIEYGRDERQIVRQLTATVVVGEDDARALRRLGGRDTVHVVPNGVALPTVSVKREDPTPTVIFSGVMAYPPNIDAVRWFAQTVWPLVRARKPLARFVIAGRAPTPEVTALAAVPGVEVLGAVLSSHGSSLVPAGMRRILAEVVAPCVVELIVSRPAMRNDRPTAASGGRCDVCAGTHTRMHLGTAEPVGQRGRGSSRLASRGDERHQGTGHDLVDLGSSR